MGPRLLAGRPSGRLWVLRTNEQEDSGSRIIRCKIAHNSNKQLVECKLGPPSSRCHISYAHTGRFKYAHTGQYNTLLPMTVMTMTTLATVMPTMTMALPTLVASVWSQPSASYNHSWQTCSKLLWVEAGQQTIQETAQRSVCSGWQ